MIRSQIGICITIIITIFQTTCHAATKEQLFTIGAIFEEDGEERDLDAALRHAIDLNNIESWFRPRTRLLWESASVMTGDSFSAYKRLCHFFGNGVNAVLGPKSPAASWHVQSTCNGLQVPHMALHEDHRSIVNESGVNLYPPPTAISQAIAEVIKSWDWFTHFTILYESQEALVRIQEILKLKDRYIQIYQLRPGEDNSVLIKKIQKDGVMKIVIDAEIATIVLLFDQLQDLGMMTDYYEYVIINYDFHTIDFSKYRDPVVNITGFQLIDPTDETYRDILNRWRLRSHEPKLFSNKDLTAPDQAITTQIALIYDSVLVLAKAISSYDVTHLLRTPVTTCEQVAINSPYDIPFPQYNKHKQRFINAIRKLRVSGLTGPISFNQQTGFRSNMNIHVIKNLATGLVRLETWNSERGLEPAIDPDELQRILEAAITPRRTLIVTSFLNPPLLMRKKNEMGEDDGYEGYVMDLVYEIHKIYPDYNFTVRPVLDEKYGDNKTGTWNGMVGELIDRKADFCIADLAITRQRQEVVDFTIPFMNLGIGILYKKEPKKEPALFSFLNPFSEDVWIYMATVSLGVSLVLFFLSRLSPYEWDNPHPCDSDPEELENQFNLINSLWFVIGSLMQQGCDFLPKAVSTRTVAGAWWFFNLILSSTYTANLAAFLTAGGMTNEITSAVHLSKQTKVKYGCVRGGATYNFFANSKTDTYLTMSRYMDSADPSVFVDNNNAGIQRVLRGDYAFFMESVFIEYQTERKCQLMSIGNPLDNKGYGVAMPKGSPYFQRMNQAVLKLQDNAMLTILKKRWWQEKGLENPCPVEPPPSNTLGIDNVGGIFVLVTGGTLFACFVGVLEFIWFTHKNVRESKPPLWKAIVNELKFAIWGDNSKPIDKSVSESETGLAMTSYSSAFFGRDPLVVT